MNAMRYQRQISLKDIGHEGQQKLAHAKVLVVGAGGLGLPVLQYLNAMGVGTLGIVEQDEIELSNLHRQILYEEKDVGKAKLKVCMHRLEAQNSNTRLIGHDSFLVRDNALEIISDYDLVVDATDNFPSRYLINDACVILKKAVVYGALHGFEAQISVFNYKEGPTYRCLYPEMPAAHEIPDCNTHGVMGVIPGIVGNLQALEVVKIICGIGKTLSGKLLIYDGLNTSFVTINFPALKENHNISKLQEHYGWHNCNKEAQISAEEFQKLLQSKGKIQLVDVRQPEEFASGHIEEALNIPLSELESRIYELDASVNTYLICQSGQRSAMAQQELLDLLPECPTFNITGGMDKYSLIYS